MATSTAALLSGIDDDIAACRAWGHNWPSRKLRPGRPLPRGFRPRAAAGGVVEVTETCPDCGKQRVSLTHNGGIYDRNVARHYVNPPNWIVISADERATPRDFQVEIFRRMDEEIIAEANRNKEPDND
jgi:hypothetical protein